MNRGLCALFLIPVLVFGLSSPAGAKTQRISENKLPNGLKIMEYRLDNGLQMLLVPDHSAPVFTYQVWFKVGSALEKLDPKLNKTGLAHLFEHMMFRGTAKYGDKVFDTTLSAAGAVGENATTWLDRTNYFESLPKEQMELAFNLESDRMVNLILNDALFKTETGAVLGERKMNEDRPSNLADRNLWDLAFDTHPYKFTTIGTEEEIRSFTAEEGRYFYKRYYAPNNATLILIGDFDTNKVLKLAEKYYGKIPSQELPKPIVPVEADQTKARVRKVSHPLANSEIVYLGYKMPNCQHPDIPALEIIGTSLATGNGSFLQKNLVQKGLASNIGAGGYRTRYPGLFMLTASLAPGVASSKALEVFKRGIDEFKEGLISDEEVTRAKNQFLLHSYLEVETQSGLGENLGESLVGSDNFLNGFQIVENSKKVTKEDLIRVAKTYFKEETSSLVILSPGKGK